MSLLLGTKGMLLEYVTGIGHETHGNVFTKRGTKCPGERKPE